MHTPGLTQPRSPSWPAGGPAAPGQTGQPSLLPSAPRITPVSHPLLPALPHVFPCSVPFSDYCRSCGFPATLTYAQAKRHGEAHMRRVDPLPLHASATPSWPVELMGLARQRP
jgi:hypothetical protein